MRPRGTMPVMTIRIECEFDEISVWRHVRLRHREGLDRRCWLYEGCYYTRIMKERSFSFQETTKVVQIWHPSLHQCLCHTNLLEKAKSVPDPSLQAMWQRKRSKTTKRKPNGKTNKQTPQTPFPCISMLPVIPLIS
jgi:hypothetical protein